MIIPRVVRRKTHGEAEFACEPCVSRAAAGLWDSGWVNQEAGVGFRGLIAGQRLDGRISHRTADSSRWRKH
jgi:hypothetical protein